MLKGGLRGEILDYAYLLQLFEWLMEKQKFPLGHDGWAHPR